MQRMGVPSTSLGDYAITISRGKVPSVGFFRFRDCPICGRRTTTKCVREYGRCARCRGPLPPRKSLSAGINKKLIVAQSAWLDYLTRKFPSRDILVQHYRTNRRHTWPCQCSKRRVYHRVLLPNEVLFDFDSEDLALSVARAQGVMDTLDSIGCDYSLAWTGGKGLHIHVWLAVRPFFWFGVDRWSLVRRVFAHRVLQESNLSLGAVDLRPTVGRNYSVRAFGCFRSLDSGRIKTLIEEPQEAIEISRRKWRKHRFEFPTKIRTFDCSTWIDTGDAEEAAVKISNIYRVGHGHTPLRPSKTLVSTKVRH